MRVSVVAFEHPDPEGTARGRSLWAWCHAMRTMGHDVETWSWGPTAPVHPLPDWCHWRPLDRRAVRHTRLRSLVHPRAESATVEWDELDDAVCVADDVPSFAAVARTHRPVVTVSSWGSTDMRALGHVTLEAWQTSRAERRWSRRSALALAYSEQLARRLRRGRRPTHVVPIAYPLPDEIVPVLEEPVAALYADWSWRPNRVALGHLIRIWPEVRDAVPGSKLLLAGPNLREASVGALGGVATMDVVRASTEVLAQAAVLAFPCPPTSGPKVKVLEALAHGLPVVTTAAGTEGLAIGPGEGAVSTDLGRFAPTLTSLLSSPERRYELGRAGREAVVLRHGPRAVARARLSAFESTFDIA